MYVLHYKKVSAFNHSSLILTYKMNIAIIGEFNPQFRPHVATNEALQHSQKKLPFTFHSQWISTENLEQAFHRILAKFDGYWIAPGSPYKSMKGALALIRYTRENRIPTLGTCGGFQHMVIEFARNVLAVEDAQHAEYDPYASKLVVNPLSCDLKGEPLAIEIVEHSSLTYQIYGIGQIREKYYCNFGLNPEYEDLFSEKGFQIVGSDAHQEARIVELAHHPFFIGTLFVPQDRSTPDQPHPLVNAFLKAANEYNLKRDKN